MKYLDGGEKTFYICGRLFLDVVAFASWGRGAEWADLKFIYGNFDKVKYNF